MTKAIRTNYNQPEPVANTITPEMVCMTRAELDAQLRTARAQALREAAENILNAVADLKEIHRNTWRTKPEWYWTWRLLLEVGELIGSLLGFHAGPIEWELIQISAICMNWIEMRDPPSLPTHRAADSTRAAHSE